MRRLTVVFATRAAVYELFDEVMDFGYPQFTEAKIMADYIKTDAHKADVHDVRQSMAVTNAVSWRSEGLKYKACLCPPSLPPLGAGRTPC